MKGVALACAAALLVLSVAASSAAPRRDYAAVALDVLPPGENGSVVFNANTNDQVALYDCLTPLFDQVRAGDLTRCFKPETLGLGRAKPVRTETLPRAGVTLVRDRWGVPHITGKTQGDVAYGMGWATAEDRGLLLSLLRGPARAAALDIPGLDPLGLALSGKSLVPSAQAEAFIARQVDLVRRSGPLGARLVAVGAAYVAGLNAFDRATNLPGTPYTLNDVAAVGALLAARFGANGGAEVRNAMFLSALQAQLGVPAGRQVYDDLREANDPEAPVTVPTRFPQELPPASAPGSVVVDVGSFQATQSPVRANGPGEGASGEPGGSPANEAAVPAEGAMSNALLVGAARSSTGHPLFVAGSQVGYFFPEFFMEVDVHGGGFDVRGALLPGLPLVLLGRGPDSAWSATSSQADDQDLFAETLCGGDDQHYLYKGQCRAMATFDAGVLKTPGKPDQPLVLHETAHGVVQGYATVAGRRVAIALERSTRGRELLGAVPLYALDTGRVSSARDFVAVASGLEASFNLVYADDRDIAFYSGGRLPVRAPGTDPSLPTVGTGQYEWRGFLPARAHAQAIDPPAGVILNWNTKPAVDVGASDDNWSYGSVQRVELLSAALGSGRKTLVQVVAAMNKAATQDLRAVRVLPAVEAVLKTGVAPSPRAQQALDLLEAWRAKGASRLDRNLDGKIDDPGAAIMDAAWPRLADAVLSPVLGPLLPLLAALVRRDDAANSQGSAYLSGWYGYLDKDLRRLLGRPVKGPFRTRFCGAGDLTPCRASLWAALEAAADELAAAQGPDPAAWRADATKERIDFTTGLIGDTMRWANRPTFQQVISFAGHRPR